MRLAFPATALAIAGLLSGCSYYFSDFVIVNETNLVVHDVSVTDGHKTWTLGDLKPGQRERFYGHLTGEGGPTIAWTINGRRHSEEGCYYTGWAPARGSVLIVGDKLSFRCK